MVLLYSLLIMVCLSLLRFGQFSLCYCSSTLDFSCDWYSFIFFVSLVSVSVSVFCWSYCYMDSESLFRRFTLLVTSFLGSIFLLVFSSNLLALLVSWDLLGFSSLFLVFFYKSRSSLAGGLLTGLTNRFGDVLFLVVVGSLFCNGAVQYTLVLLLLVPIGMTKSAQVPFSAWLPAAIAAPTPVSALVHSSTLVTAGVWLLLRFAVSLPTSLLYIGLCTMVVSGSAAAFVCDTKKIIALSTLSQIGIMVSALGLRIRSLCFAHLNAHASFKALLFMVAGTLIHSSYGSQESRNIYCLGFGSPFLNVLGTVSCASLCGFVFTSGWVTKDAILEFCLGGSFGLLALLCFYLGLVLTCIYSLRLWSLFFGLGGSRPVLSSCFACS